MKQAFSARCAETGLKCEWKERERPGYGKGMGGEGERRSGKMCSYVCFCTYSYTEFQLMSKITLLLYNVFVIKYVI